MAYIPKDAVGMVVVTGQTRYAMVDIEDAERLNQFKWNAHPRSLSIQRIEKIAPTRFHNYSLASEVMQQPYQLFDHINRDTFDNRKCNLRPCTLSQNMANKQRYKNAKHKYKGAYPKSGKWQAELRYEGKLYSLGRFNTEEEAAHAYDTKAKELFGAFATLNFPI